MKAYKCPWQYAPMAKQKHYIKEWRKHRGMTQDEFGELVGVDRSYVSKIETGKQRYDQPFLEAAAQILKVQPAELLSRAPKDPDGIWSIWEELNSTERLRLVEIGKTLKRTGTNG